MFQKIIQPYKGLSKEVWILALTTLINRAGAMVVPFLALYLTNYLEFTMEQVGWIMSCFGFGSLAGTFIGGKLADRLGYHLTMYVSLLGGGLVFLALQYLSDYYHICVGIFILSLIADMFRPAMWVALDNYSLAENRTRSVTLIRLAINLGFSMGPALGGLIITWWTYKGIFIIDGITCLTAGLIIAFYLSQKTEPQAKKETVESPRKSPYKDRHFLIFWVALFLIGFTFMQYFSTMPLYYSEVLFLSEDRIGLLLASNGLLIFLLEMPLVNALEKSKLNHLKIVIAGTLLLLLSFLILNLAPWIGLAIVGIVLMTFGEMLGFPFSNSFALDRSKKGRQGDYMALYSMSFSVAHILGPNIGMQFSAQFGFENTWYLMGFLCLISCAILFYLQQRIAD